MNHTISTPRESGRAPRRLRRHPATTGIVVVAAILATTMLGGPAYAEGESPAPVTSETPAESPVETPAPVVDPAPGADEESASPEAQPTARPQLTQTIANKAVPTAATGFKLQYAFDAAVQPSHPTLGSGITADESYDWTDGGVRNLQWDFSMPEDGHHTVTFSAGLIDYGTLTDYTIKYTSTINRTGGSIAVRTVCAITQDGAAVEESPFSCDSGSAQGASGPVLSTATVSENNWSSITGIIDVRNESSGPVISLAEGTFATANQQRRIIMDGEAWYPVDASVEERKALPYATVANGRQVTWMAAQQNFGVSQAEPDTHAQATFSYRIVLDGEPTPYWINGWAETYKWEKMTYPTATCSVYLGDPNGTGVEVAASTPFTCTPTGMTKPNIRLDDDTTFQVRMVHVDTVSDSNDAKLRGIVQACSDGGKGCIQTIGEPALHVADAAGAKVIKSNSNTQGETKAKDWKFEESWSREVTDSAEQTFGIKTSVETEETFAGVSGKLGIEISSETSYGYDLTKGLEYKISDYSQIPFGAIGSYVQFEAWNVYRGDIYFMGEGDSWYRVSGTTITIPIDANSYGADSQFDGHLDAATGAGAGMVQFRCVWDDAHEANVLLHNPTVEALTACEIPDTWSDVVPAVPGVELESSLIRDARAILADDLDALNTSVQEQSEKLK